MPTVVRPAEAADLPLLPAIERSADRLFAQLGIVFPDGPTVVEEVSGDGAQLLVAGDPPRGFAATRPLDGGAYLEQIAVHPDHIRQGIGGALLTEVVRRAAPLDVTLLTFRDVPWNAPWYARHGFVRLPAVEWTVSLREHWQAEIEAGLHDLGARMIMRRRGAPGG